MSSHAYGNNGPSSRGVVTAEPVVAVTSLTKRFGAFVAVDDLTFALEAGTVTGFLGPNGAGKTTTLRVLLGLDEPANGLDPAGVHWLRTFLRSFADRGGTVLVASHALAEVAQTVDRVLIIDGGRLVASTSLEELAGRGQTLEDAYLQLTTEAAS